MHYIATSATPAPEWQSGQLFKLRTIKGWWPERCSSLLCHLGLLSFPLLNFVYFCFLHTASVFLVSPQCFSVFSSHLVDIKAVIYLQVVSCLEPAHLHCNSIDSQLIPFPKGYSILEVFQRGFKSVSSSFKRFK